MSSSEGRGGIATILRYSVVLAAAAGGWFGYEQYLASDAATASANGASSGDSLDVAPWPDDLVIPDIERDGYATTVQPLDDVVR